MAETFTQFFSKRKGQDNSLSLEEIRQEYKNLYEQGTSSIPDTGSGKANILDEKFAREDESIANNKAILSELGFGANLERNNIRFVQKEIDRLKANATTQDERIRAQNAQKALSELSTGLTNLDSRNTRYQQSLTAQELAERRLPQRSGVNQAIVEAVFATGDQNYINEYLNRLSPDEAELAGQYVPQANLQFGDTLKKEIATNPAFSQPFDIEAARLAAPSSRFSNVPRHLLFERPKPPGPEASEGALKAFEHAMAVYKENQQIAEELNKSIVQRLGSEANIGAELTKLREENTQFRANLDEELGISGADERIKALESNFGLLVDKNDEEFRSGLKELQLMQGSGELSNEEYAQRFTNLVLKRGQPITNFLDDGATQAGGASGGASPGAVPVPPGTQPGGSPGLVPSEGGGVNFSVGGIPINFPSGAISDPNKGIISYTDPSSNITFQSNPNSNKLDLSKLSDDDIINLSGAQLLKAETRMFLDQANKDADSQDDFFTMLTEHIVNTSESSKQFVLSLSEIELEKTRLEQMKAQDQIAYEQNQLEIAESETFQDLAVAESKMEGYLKGKLAAYGASSSSAAISIMSANKLKFAKERARTKSKFSAESTRLQQLQTYSQLAYTNSIIEIRTRENQALTDITNNTQNKLLDILGQKLKSDSEKDREKLGLHLNYIKGIRQLNADALEAQRQAQKDAWAFYKDGVQMSGWMADQTGTVWTLSEDGQLVNTGKPTFKREIEEAKLAISRMKAAGSGKSGDTVDANSLINALRFSKNPETGRPYTDEEIANVLPVLYPGTSEKANSQIREGLEILRITDSPYAEVGPLFETAYNLPEFYVPAEKLSFSEQLSQGILSGLGGGGFLSGSIARPNIPLAE